MGNLECLIKFSFFCWGITVQSSLNMHVYCDAIVIVLGWWSKLDEPFHAMFRTFGPYAFIPSKCPNCLCLCYFVLNSPWIGVQFWSTWLPIKWGFWGGTEELPRVHIPMYNFHWPHKSESHGISRIHSEDGLRISRRYLPPHFEEL